MPWTIEDEIRRAEAEDAHAAWWEEYTESVNDAWVDLTTLPTVITIMGNPVRLDSTGMPPWLTAATEPPDALQSADDDGQLRAAPSAAPTTGPIPMTASTTVPLVSNKAAITGPSPKPSTTVLASLSTESASGTTKIITVFSTLVTNPSTLPSIDNGTRSTTKIIIGIAILVVIVLIAIFLIGGYILGRRASVTSDKSGKRTLWLPWPARKHGEYVESEDQKHLDPSTEEIHELPGGDVVHEMLTEVNIQEMAEVREPVELPAREPVGLGDEIT